MPSSACDGFENEVFWVKSAVSLSEQREVGIAVTIMPCMLIIISAPLADTDVAVK